MNGILSSQGGLGTLSGPMHQAGSLLGLGQTRPECQSISNTLQQVQGEILQRQQDIATSNGELIQIVNELSRLQGQRSGMQSRLRDVQPFVNQDPAAAAEAAELNGTIQGLTGAIGQLNTAHANVSNEMRETEGRIADLQDTRQELESQLRACNAARPAPATTTSPAPAPAPVPAPAPAPIVDKRGPTTASIVGGAMLLGVVGAGGYMAYKKGLFG